MTQEPVKLMTYAEALEDMPEGSKAPDDKAKLMGYAKRKIEQLKNELYREQHLPEALFLSVLRECAEDIEDAQEGVLFYGYINEALAADDCASYADALKGIEEAAQEMWEERCEEYEDFSYEWEIRAVHSTDTEDMPFLVYQDEDQVEREEDRIPTSKEYFASSKH